MDPTYPTDPATDPGMLTAVTGGVQDADAAQQEQERIEKAEENTVKALWEEYETARKFDKDARAQYGVDRRYAAGTANLNWAVSTNLIGAFCDILVSFLFARNPDVSVKKAPRIDNTGTAEEDDFAKTMELVISSLWKAPSTRMKPTVRQMIRSVLSVGPGWAKAILVCNGTNIPQMRTQLNDVRQNIAQLEALRVQLAPPAPLADSLSPPVDGGSALPAPLGDETGQPAAPSPPLAAEFQGETLTLEQIDAKTAEFNELQASIQQRMEVALRKGLALDFVAAEDMQVSLDVRCYSDYVNANWVANQIFRPKSKVTSLFEGLTEKDVQSATCYHQRSNRDLTPLSADVRGRGTPEPNTNVGESEQYISSKEGTGNTGDEKGIEFVRVVELWNRETGHVHTMIEGLKRWAKQPYQPDYASTRFYPYFMLEFYPVDGARHPQSLSWRLMKLMDEYSSVRSSLRLTRSRAAPGVLFNSTGLDPVEAQKLVSSTHQELIGIKPTQADQRLQDLFAPKPIELGDLRLYDTQPITADMEKMSGVQEALQSSVTTEKTATEAEIQQSGFSARTTADRDALETLLSDLAQYTGELAIQGLDQNDATRIAGAKAFWPHGMAIDDLLTMVEIQIEAGTTGKPKSSGDKAAWGTIMPVIIANIEKIQMAQAMGNLPLANALTEVIKETMHRMGDETDVSRFIPQMPVTPPMQPGMGAPGAVPGSPTAAAVPGAVPPGNGAGSPPVEDSMGPPDVGAPPGPLQ